MLLVEKLEAYGQKKRRTHSEKIRKKNENLAAQGINMSKKKAGWGTLVHGGGVGASGLVSYQPAERLSITDCLLEEQKRVREEKCQRIEKDR